MGNQPKRKLSDGEIESLVKIKTYLKLTDREFTGTDPEVAEQIFSHTSGNNLLNPNHKKNNLYPEEFRKLIQHLWLLYFEKKETLGNFEDYEIVFKNLLSLEFDIPVDRIITKSPGSVLSNTINYIHRGGDKILLEYRNASICLLHGGPKSGVSSCLRSMRKKLEDDSRKTILIDFLSLSSLYQPERILDKETGSWNAGVFFSALLYEVRQELNLPGEVSGIYKEYRFAESSNPARSFMKGLKDILSRPDVEEVHLLFDGVQCLDDLQPGLIAQFNGFLIELNKKSDFEPFDRLYIISTISERSITYANQSGIEYQAPQIDLKCFNKDQVNQLLKIYGESPRLGNKLMSLYGGQPYLTHLAITYLKIHGTLEKVFEKSLNEIAEFRKYWLASKNRVESLLLNEEGSRDIKEIFAIIYNAPPGGELNGLTESLERIDLITQEGTSNSLFIKEMIRKEL